MIGILPHIPELLFKYRINFRNSNPFYYPVIYSQIRSVAAKVHTPCSLEYYPVIKMIPFQIIPDVVYNIPVTP